mgnify:CR=1 FL=1|tara:strand:+ start:3486 stop:3953 length:468 start_codon:yes stop_codon:yes gene_type:complete
MKKLLNLFSVLILISGCGFKVLEDSNLENFYIEDVKITGDSRVNFNIKNKLLLKTNNKSKNSISLIIVTNKEKKIKEKNDKNIITKYLININLQIKVESNNNLIKTFSLSEQIDFNVNTQYSQTINNEKQAIKNITEVLVDKIIRELSDIEPNDL